IRKQTAEAVKEGVGERKSLKLRGMASETTSSTRAIPKTTSLKTSSLVMASPRRRKLSSVGGFWERIRSRAGSEARARLGERERTRTGLGDRMVHVQNRGDEVAERHAQMADHPLLEGGVVLSAAENVGHQLPEDGTAAHELNHARGDGSAKERAAVKPA